MWIKLIYGDKVCIIFIRIGVWDFYFCYSSGYWLYFYQEVFFSVGCVYGGGGGWDDCVFFCVYIVVGDVWILWFFFDYSWFFFE